MNDKDFKPNYKTRRDVEVEAVYIGGLWHAKPAWMADILSGACCSETEFDALFEPIPKVPTVTLPYDLALRYWNQQQTDEDTQTLRAAIAEADREEAT